MVVGFSLFVLHHSSKLIIIFQIIGDILIYVRVGKINTFLLMKPLLITSFDVTEKYGRNGEISETYRKIKRV